MRRGFWFHAGVFLVLSAVCWQTRARADAAPPGAGPRITDTEQLIDLEQLRKDMSNAGSSMTRLFGGGDLKNTLGGLEQAIEEDDPSKIDAQLLKLRDQLKLIQRGWDNEVLKSIDQAIAGVSISVDRIDGIASNGKAGATSPEKQARIARHEEELNRLSARLVAVPRSSRQEQRILADARRQEYLRRLAIGAAGGSGSAAETWKSAATVLSGQEQRLRDLGGELQAFSYRLSDTREMLATLRTAAQAARTVREINAACGQIAGDGNGIASAFGAIGDMERILIDAMGKLDITVKGFDQIHPSISQPITISDDEIRQILIERQTISAAADNRTR